MPSLDLFMRKYLSTLLLQIIAISAWSGAPKYSNDYLNIGVGARYLALGSCGNALVNDITSGYWNPAGLVEINNKLNFGFMHAEYFAGIANYDYIAASRRIDENSVIGASVIRLGVDGILNTIDLIDKDGNFNYDNISKFSVADYAFLTSYAKRSKIDGLHYGGNVKIIYRNYGKFASAYGFGFDLGAQYIKEKWLFGATIRDITSTFNIWVFNEDELEITILDSVFNKAPDNSIEVTLPRIIIGLGRNFMISEKFGITPLLDLEITTDGKRHTLINSNLFSIDPRFGLEFNYKKIVYLRAGINNMQMTPDFDKDVFTFQPNFGLGVNFKGIHIDYALTDIGSNSVLYSHVFSLLLSIK